MTFSAADMEICDACMDYRVDEDGRPYCDRAYRAGRDGRLDSSECPRWGAFIALRERVGLLGEAILRMQPEYDAPGDTEALLGDVARLLAAYFPSLWCAELRRELFSPHSGALCDALEA